MKKLVAPAVWIPLTFIGCVVTTLILPFGSDIQVLAFIGLFFMIALFLVIFAHELGHVIAAVFARFQIIKIVVGPILVSLQAKGYALKPNMDSQNSLGMVFALPMSFEKLRSRTAIYAAGGPIANLVIGILFAVLAGIIAGTWTSAIPHGISPANFTIWWSGCLVGIVGWLSLIIGVVNLMPFETRIAPSDGSQLLRSIRGGQSSDRYASLLVMNKMNLALCRPGQYPAEILEQALALQDNSSSEAMANFLAYLNALDNQQDENAEKYLTRVKALRRVIPEIGRFEIASWIAFHEAYYHQATQEARLWLNEAYKLHSSPHIVQYLANASVLFLEGHNEEAVKYASLFAETLVALRSIGAENTSFYKLVMEKVTKRYIKVIKPILDQKANSI